MTLDPWVIEQLEEEARSQEEEASRSHRIELPQTRPLADRSEENHEATPSVAVVDLSPSGGTAFDL